MNVTCETAPHYLVMDDGDLQEDGRFKMNPPLRGKADREALVAGILDGTIDMIATDHAPHSAEEKSRGLANSAFGIVGIETAFPLLYTKLVKPGILSREKLLDLLVYNARETQVRSQSQPRQRVRSAVLLQTSRLITARRSTFTLRQLEHLQDTRPAISTSSRLRTCTLVSSPAVAKAVRVKRLPSILRLQILTL